MNRPNIIFIFSDQQHDSIRYYENEAGPFPVDTWGPTGLTDLAIQFMEPHKRKDNEAPFLLLMSWGPRIGRTTSTRGRRGIDLGQWNGG